MSRTTTLTYLEKKLAKTNRHEAFLAGMVHEITEVNHDRAAANEHAYTWIERTVGHVLVSYFAPTGEWIILYSGNVYSSDRLAAAADYFADAII